jgi:hypothetical protein
MVELKKYEVVIDGVDGNQTVHFCDTLAEVGAWLTHNDHEGSSVHVVVRYVLPPADYGYEA